MGEQARRGGRNDLQRGDEVVLVQTYRLTEYEHHARHGRWPWEEPDGLAETVTRRVTCTVHWRKRDGSVQVVDGKGSRYMLGPNGVVRDGLPRGTVRLARNGGRDA